MKPILTIYEEHLAPIKFRNRKRVRTRKVYGEHEENRLAVDPRQNEEEYLDTLLHEMHHFADPDASEDTVLERTAVFSVVLWRMGYRRIRL